MIIDTAMASRLRAWSDTKVLCRCDECGTERMISMASITSRHGGWYLRCQRCRAAEVCRRYTGTKRSEQHRIRTGLASFGRRQHPKHTEAFRIRSTGMNNHNWNPNRWEVWRKDRARRTAYSLLHGVLSRVGVPKKGSTVSCLGYTPDELFAHITAQLTDGMTWEDRRAWHIDHVKPVSAFVAEGVTDTRVINALSNLAPVWKQENLTKGSNWTVVGK